MCNTMCKTCICVKCTYKMMKQCDKQHSNNTQNINNDSLNSIEYQY